MRKVNRKRHAIVTTTAEGCRVTTNGSEITLESPKATVTAIGKANREWLARDVFSTPYAEIRS